MQKKGMITIQINSTLSRTQQTKNKKYVLFLFSFFTKNENSSVSVLPTFIMFLVFSGEEKDRLYFIWKNKREKKLQTE